MNTVTVTTDSRTVTTKDLRKWIARTYGKKAYFGSFNFFEGIILGSILRSNGDNSSTPIERVRTVVDKETGRELTLSEVLALTDDTYQA